MIARDAEEDDLRALRCGEGIITYLPTFVYILGIALVLKHAGNAHISRSVTALNMYGPPGKLLLLATIITEALRVWARLIILVDIVCDKYFKNLNQSRWVLNMKAEGVGKHLKPVLSYALDTATIKVTILALFSILPLLLSLLFFRDEPSRFRIVWMNGRRMARTELGEERYYLWRPCRGLENPSVNPGNNLRPYFSDTALITIPGYQNNVHPRSA